MKNTAFILIVLIIYVNASAQKFHIGINGGISNYKGDLPDKIYVDNQTKMFGGLLLHYELTEQLFLRAGLNFGAVSASDKFSTSPAFQQRNLSFESAISEFHIGGELYLFNLSLEKLSPYVFAGIGAFHFDPYTFDSSNRQVYLKPLSTEGQGIYPNKKPYKLTQPVIPFGGGLKVLISENLMMGFEIGFRKLFTDYLDDISTTYADYNDLLAARGQLAVDLSYRGDEVPGGNPAYPAKGTQRGSSAQKDLYYFAGLNISLRLGNGPTLKNKPSKKGNFGCPAVPF